MDQNKKMYTFLFFILLEILVIISLLVWTFIKMPTKAQIFCLVVPILRASLKVRKKRFLDSILTEVYTEKEITDINLGKIPDWLVFAYYYVITFCVVVVCTKLLYWLTVFLYG